MHRFSAILSTLVLTALAAVHAADTGRAQSDFFDGTTSCANRPVFVTVQGMPCVSQFCQTNEVYPNQSSTVRCLSDSGADFEDIVLPSAKDQEYVVVAEYLSSSRCRGNPGTVRATLATNECHPDGNGSYIIASCEGGRAMTRFCMDEACEYCQYSPDAGCTSYGSYSTEVYCHQQRQEDIASGKFDKNGGKVRRLSGDAATQGISFMTFVSSTILVLLGAIVWNVPS